MGFNWVIFLAQIINLFVLIWLMKRFLYEPIIRTIEKRQAYIEDKVKSAANAVVSAEKQQKELEKKTLKWDKDKQKRLEDLYTNLNHIKESELEKLSNEMTLSHIKMQEDLNRETASLTLEIRNMMAAQFLGLSKQILSDFSGLAPLDQAILLFQKKVESAPKKELDKIKKLFEKQNVINIFSSKTLSKKNEQDLTRFLTKHLNLAPSVKIQFQTNPDLILGIEMTIGEIILEWNLKTYLDSFENNLNAVLSGLIIKKE